MEAYNEKETNITQEAKDVVVDGYEKTKSFLSAWFGVILTILSIGIIFIVASLEGQKEIAASNSVSGKLLAMWREDNEVVDVFPEEKVDVIEYKSREYYFVVDEYNVDGEIIKWHFAYDGGIEYIFMDYKYYVLVGVTLVFSIFVSSVNYNSTVEKVIGTSKFTMTLSYYQKQKEAVKKYTHLIPRFCLYKNKQKYDEEKRNIVEKANIDWSYYTSKDFDLKKLTRWQRRQLKKIRKIKIIRITSSDLLQEQNFNTGRIRILAEGQSENRRKFLVKTMVSRFLSTAMSGLVAGFGVVIGNWVLGLVFAGTILSSAIGAIIAGADYGSNTLKNRFIGKGDLLNEFYNMVDVFLEEEKKELEAKNPKTKEQPKDIAPTIPKNDIMIVKPIIVPPTLKTN